MPIIEYEGVRHEFPDDFTDADIAAALQAEPAQQSEGKSVGGFFENAVKDAGNTAMGVLKMINPIDALTGPGSGPIDSLVAGNKAKKAQEAEWAQQPGAGSGQMPPTPQSLGADLGDEVYERPVSTAMLAAPMLRPRVSLAPVKKGLQNVGVRVMRGAVKAPTSELQRVSGSAQQGLDATAAGVARNFLETGVNPGRASGLEKIQRNVEAGTAARDAGIAAVPQLPVQGSGNRQLAALRPIVQKARQQSAPEPDVKSVTDFGRAMTRNPAMSIKSPTAGRQREMLDLTPDELNTLNKGDNRATSGLWGKVGDTEIDARKAVIRARNEMLDEAAPGTREIGQQVSRDITGRNVANLMRRRTEGNNVFGLTDMISLSSGHPATFALSTAMRPAVQAAGAGALYRTGAALPSQIDMAALYRLALLQQLQGDDDGR